MPEAPSYHVAMTPRRPFARIGLVSAAWSTVAFRVVAVVTVLLAVLSAPGGARAQELKTRNVVLVTLDGARTQEIFGGLDLTILKDVTRKGAAEDTPLYKRYWAETPVARREKLFPFLWGKLLRDHGSIAGNRLLGSTVELTNTHRFSYPGYSEILTGRPLDQVIDSNTRRLNPQVTVLETLRGRLGLDRKQVAAFASWDVLAEAVFHEKDAFTANAGFMDYDHPDPVIQELSGLQHLTETPWDSVRHDAYTFRFAMAHLKTHKPRVLFLSFGQPDDWSHDGHYDRVLQSLERIDGFLRELWETLQADEAYRDRTTILITTDHGRGNTTADWKDHGASVEGAQYIWLICASPDSPLRGEWINTETIHQAQVAATLARFLGVDFLDDHPAAARPIAQLFPRSS